MRIPDVSQWSPGTRYIKAVWQRVGGVWRTKKQSEVASALGISLSTLKRYMTQEGTCPYLVQFGLESLAGMSETGLVYEIKETGSRRAGFCTELLPFAAGGSGPTLSYIALTSAEQEKLSRLAADAGIDISVIPHVR